MLRYRLILSRWLVGNTQYCRSSGTGPGATVAAMTRSRLATTGSGTASASVTRTANAPGTTGMATQVGVATTVTELGTLATPKSGAVGKIMYPGLGAILAAIPVMGML